MKITSNIDVYSHIDELYQRYKQFCDNKIENARHDEFQAALIIFNANTSKNPYQSELYDRFKAYYKINSPTIANDVIAFIHECKRKHLERKEQELNAKATIGIHFDKERKGIYRFIPGIIKHSPSKEYIINIDFFDLDELRILSYLVHQIVFERTHNYLKAKYPKMIDPDHIGYMLTELEPDQVSDKLTLPNISWGISQTAVADLFFQLVNERVRNEDGDMPVLSPASEKDLYILLRIADPRFKDTSDNTIKGYFAKKRNVPKNNKIDIKIIP